MYAPLTESESKSGKVSEAALHHTHPCDLCVQSAHMSPDLFIFCCLVSEMSSLLTWHFCF